MQFDPRTVVTTMGVMALLFTVLVTAVWWTRRTHPGYSRWTLAGPLLLLSLFLLSLRPTAPDWISVLGANAVIAFASILYLEGARQFGGLPPRRWLPYAGGVVAVGVVAFFLYVVPSFNARAALMSTFLGVVLLRSALTLLREIPPPHRLGLRLTGGLFALSAATNVARAVYCAFGPRISDLFMLSGVSGALFLGIAAQMSLFPIGFILLADERVIADLQDARERVRHADTEMAQRRAAEAVLRESERLFRTMANAAPVMIWMSGVDKLRTYFNQGWRDFTGRPLEAELGNGWAEGVHADDREQCLKTYIEAFDRREPFHIEYRLLRRDGEYRWIFDQGVPTFSGDGVFVGYIGSGIDVTEHKLAEEALSTVSRKLIGAQEEERARVARELHDDIGQQVTLLSLEIEQFRRRGGRLRRNADRLADGAIDRLHQLARSLHDLTHRLHPPKLEIIGLVSAVSGLARELSRPDLTIAFAHNGVPAVLRPEITISLFRVVQEALQNAVKHSGAHHVSVQMSGDPDGLVLTIADEGVGFDVDLVHRNKGLGLVSMVERLALIGGSLKIMSRPGGGTRLEIRAPLPAPTVVAGETRSAQAMS